MWKGKPLFGEKLNNGSLAATVHVYCCANGPPNYFTMWSLVVYYQEIKTVNSWIGALKTAE